MLYVERAEVGGGWLAAAKQKLRRIARVVATKEVEGQVCGSVNCATNKKRVAMTTEIDHYYYYAASNPAR